VVPRPTLTSIWAFPPGSRIVSMTFESKDACWGNPGVEDCDRRLVPGAQAPARTTRARMTAWARSSRSRVWKHVRRDSRYSTGLGQLHGGLQNRNARFDSSVPRLHRCRLRARLPWRCGICRRDVPLASVRIAPLASALIGNFRSLRRSTGMAYASLPRSARETPDP
jgi:hypothetical protein